MHEALDSIQNPEEGWGEMKQRRERRAEEGGELGERNIFSCGGCGAFPTQGLATKPWLS